ncbi:MAG: helix-turn-helix domain-containing protein [Steroidobacteraceae bacterium]|nr:helix-turn-helix domain-containing protein [Steroidobacteraceae bacterium]MDW8258212.1 substrate-binding domain-containing protein [Gammaproteobacteria bacterium]
MAARRSQRGWSQAELARRAGLPRTTVNAIERARLTPSVSTALALARALQCSVESLFESEERRVVDGDTLWAWPPPLNTGRFWEAEVDGRRWWYPVEALSVNAIPHDGVWRANRFTVARDDRASRTLVMACCDPAAGWLASAYSRASGLRLLVFPRSGAAALDLLRQGRVHMAGIHRTTVDEPTANAESVRVALGSGFALLRVAEWQEGLLVPAQQEPLSIADLFTRQRRWALREPGSAARECLDALSGGQALEGRIVAGHEAVGHAVRAGWAEAGIGVQLIAEQFGLGFLSIRTETLDLCCREELLRDRRVRWLLRVLRSRTYRRFLDELPGYASRGTGEIDRI